MKSSLPYVPSLSPSVAAVERGVCVDSSPPPLLPLLRSEISEIAHAGAPSFAYYGLPDTLGRSTNHRSLGNSFRVGPRRPLTECPPVDEPRLAGVCSRLWRLPPLPPQAPLHREGPAVHHCRFRHPRMGPRRGQLCVSRFFRFLRIEAQRSEELTFPRRAVLEAGQKALVLNTGYFGDA